MDVLEDAIYDFSEVLEFFEEWKTALGASKSDEDIEGESLERYLFLMTMKRHVSIARKLMIDLYDCFDVYVIEKNRNPFIIKRPGKRNKKFRFGRRHYKIQVETKPHEIFPLFQETAQESFTKKELGVINKLYNGTVKICRLQSFIDDIAIDPVSEEGEEVTVEVVTTTGTIVRGILTYSPNGSTEKEIKEHLDVTHTCKNMSGVEMHFIGDVEFGLKLVLAKLKRMKTPYVTPILKVVKLGEVGVGSVKDTEMSVEQNPPQLARDVPPEGTNQEAPEDKAVTVEEEGRGDVSPSLPVVGWKGMQVTVPDDKYSSPFSEHPEPYDDTDSEIEAPNIRLEDPGRIESINIPYRIPRSICTIQ